LSVATPEFNRETDSSECLSIHYFHEFLLRPQRFSDSTRLKRGGWMGPPQTLVNLRVQEREAVPVKCAEILPIIREVGVRGEVPY